MEARDLRIGNVVKDKNGTALRIEYFIGTQDAHVDVALLDFPTGNAHDVDLNDLSPIPLTEQWLLRLGFKMSGDIYFYKEHAFIGLTIIYNIHTYKVILQGSEDELRLDVGFLFVHQLQNLYYALTGEELTIKP